MYVLSGEISFEELVDFFIHGIAFKHKVVHDHCVVFNLDEGAKRITLIREVKIYSTCYRDAMH